MKKLTKFLGIIACAFVLVLSSAILTACGGEKPYSVKGVTLKGSSECSIVWDEDATQEDKQRLWDAYNVSNDEELLADLTENDGEFYSTFTCVFDANGGFVMSATEGSKEKSYEGYYSQSSDLQRVELYHDAEHTQTFSHFAFQYIDGRFNLDMPMDGEWHINIYFVFNKI